MTIKAGHSITTCKYFYKLSIYNPTHALCDTQFKTLHYTTLHYNTPPSIIQCAWRIWTSSLQIIWNHARCLYTLSTDIKSTKKWQIWWPKCYIF